MKWMGVNEIREAFLSFFESKGHYRLPSYPLVPKDDNSLLLINSGMAPMKKFFVGEQTPPSLRVTTCQKCIRTIDIENVGITSRHLTYFEMLGNFSFGDYFKTQAIPWAWEFFTETLQIPRELLHISVYLDDDDAYDIWTRDIGIDPSHMVRLGKEDNFWEHGAGPCGPCSELYFDRGEEHGCGRPDCAAGCECDRYVEIGNIVFTQFESDGKGTYTPIAKPNIDFGMGLERLSTVLQGADNVFMIDTMRNIMKKAEELSGVTYGADAKKDVSLKVIADHMRSITFMVGDGVLGSNEGRGYVLRRLLRRAARHGRLLGIRDVFLKDIVEVVIRENETAYPDLAGKREMICRVVQNEEESFARTIDQGLSMLGSFVEKMQEKLFSGDHAFLLNDTYGFPLDLTKEILAERGLQVDEERFQELMRLQRERARSARKNAGADAWEGEGDAAEGLPETVFEGYGVFRTDSRVLRIINQDGESVQAAGNGEAVTLMLDKTPFYAESGGQVADTGVIVTKEAVCTVTAVTKTTTGVYLHRAVVSEGILTAGDGADAKVDAPRRQAIMRNHTAAHLLQAALQKVLGTHVAQAGQLVDEHRMRFDFTHFAAMTPEEVLQTEQLVNEAILEAIPVTAREMPIDEARGMGAMALFGEKYGDVVRVVSVGDLSKELCGGTHMDNTARLGLFKITSEASVAAGVRRIEGVTGTGILKLLADQQGLILGTAHALKANNYHEMPLRAEQIMTELKEKDRELEKLGDRMAASRIEGLFEHAPEMDGIKIITEFFSGTGTDALKSMCDIIKSRPEPVIAVLAGAGGGKASIVATASEAAQKMGIKAGQLVKEVAILTGGNGGGRPDFAMAGAKDADKIESALAAVKDIVENLRK